MYRRKNLLSLVIPAVLLIAGCSKSKDEEKKSSEGAAETPAWIAGSLAAYEEIRAKLVEDDVAVTEAAAALEKAASAGTAEAPEKLRVHLEELASAAGALEELDKGDPAAVRKAFGEVSRPLVALLAKAPEIAEGRHVFECPMAKGYQKWVQPSAGISNPYMGTSMPKCGSETEWSP